MDDEELTVDEIKELALASGPMSTIYMMAEGGPVVEQLMMTAQLHKQGHSLRQMAASLRNVSDAPEHTDLALAMVTAAKAATVAFEAAANAAWQMYWASTHCPCDQCKHDRLRDKAPFN